MGSWFSRQTTFQRFVRASDVSDFDHAYAGGPEGAGWPFGRHLYVSDGYQCLQGIPDVLYLREVEIYAAKPGGEAEGAPLEEIDVVDHGVIASGLHAVEFV